MTDSFFIDFDKYSISHFFKEYFNSDEKNSAPCYVLSRQDRKNMESDEERIDVKMTLRKFMIHTLLSVNISSRFSSNSGAFASELLEHIEENVSSIQHVQIFDNARRGRVKRARYNKIPY